MNEICRMELAKTILYLLVRETFTCTILRESAAEFFLLQDHSTCKLVRDFLGLQSLGLLSLVFDIGLSVTPLMGRLRCLESRVSVPVSTL